MNIFLENIEVPESKNSFQQMSRAELKWKNCTGYGYSTKLNPLYAILSSNLLIDVLNFWKVKLEPFL